MNVGGYIRDKRKEKKLTLKQLANDIGLSYTYLSQIELGDRNASPEILEKIAKALDVPHRFLMEKAGHAKESDRLEILQTQLLSLQEAKNLHNAQLDTVTRELSRSDLDKNIRKHLEKVFDERTSEIQRIDKAIEEVNTLIRNSEQFNKGLSLSKELNNKFGSWGNSEDIPLGEIKKTLEDNGYTLKKNTQQKTELETLFNSTQAITINGKTLTDDEKQKALQILKLTFDK